MEFGNMIAPAANAAAPAQTQVQNPVANELQTKQKLLKMVQEIKILKRGGKEAMALMQQKAAEGKPPPDLDLMIAQAQ